MSSLFLVESPLQLLNAVEAMHQMASDENSILIIFRGVSQKNLDQMMTILDDSWREVHVLKNTYNRWRLAQPMRELDNILRKLEKIDFVFIGEYRSILMRHVANKSNALNKLLLDDGNYSLYIQRRILDHKGERSSYHFIRKLYDRLLGINDKDIFDIRFFSVYDLNVNASNNERFVKNLYLKAKSKLKAKKKTKEVWFIGNNTPEIGVISESYYFESIKKIKSFYSEYKIIYIPHRRESQDKIEMIKSLFGLEIKWLDRPVELFLLDQPSIPARMGSMFSSALDNCFHIFGSELAIDSFKIDFDQIISPDYVQRVKLNYETYENYESDSFNIHKI